MLGARTGTGTLDNAALLAGSGPPPSDLIVLGGSASDNRTDWLSRMGGFAEQVRIQLVCIKLVCIEQRPLPRQTIFAISSETLNPREDRSGVQMRFRDH